MNSTANTVRQSQPQNAYNLAAILDAQVDGMSRKAVAEHLRVSLQTLRKDTRQLLKINPRGFIHQPNARGYLICSVEVLQEFRKLVDEVGRSLALLKISERMERIYESRNLEGFQTRQNAEPTKWATPPKVVA